ncbi:MAG: mechanosensitive ion channel domain-containing protein [Candidatus Omnitrophota bacterium]
MKTKRVIAFLMGVIFCLAVNVSCARAEDQKDATGAQAGSKTPGQELDGQKAAQVEVEIKEVKEEAATAKAEAEAAQLEAEKAKKEVELHKKAAEIDKQKLETEIKETEVSKKEAEIAQKTAASKAEVKEAIKKTKQEEGEDQIAKEKARATEEKMNAARMKAALAEEQLKLANEKLALAMEKIREKTAKRSLTAKLTESAVTVLIGLAVVFLMKAGIKKFERSLTKKDEIRASEATLQIKTLVKLFNWLGTILICIVVFYIVAEKHGLNVAPLVAGAGIAGLAFGFGGQYLIRDLINGMFILIEGQYRVDDVVKIGEYGGLVEDINLRITTLRDLEGRVIIVPNGEVKIVVNYTREYAQALLNIGVAYKENVDHVMDVIKEIAGGMRKDKYFGRLILGDVEMLGVDDFADSQVTIKFRVKTLPIKQWEVMRELRRRIKNRFDELGIEIPFPHRTIYWGAGKDNEWVKDFADRISARGPA